MGVALLLARAGADEDVIAAGLLHDTVEDCDVTLEQLASEFGLWTWLRFNRGRDQQGWYYRGMVDCLRPENDSELHAAIYRELETEVSALFGPH